MLTADQFERIAEALPLFRTAPADIRVTGQININTPYLLPSPFTKAAKRQLRATKFMDTMVDKDAARFLKHQTRDVM